MAALLRLDPEELALIGYTNDGGVLYSKFSGRPFNLLDTEHFLCKVYVLLTIAYPSRTISLSPYCFNTYTWPVVADIEEWSVEFKEEMTLVIIDTYRKILRGNPVFRESLLETYPEQLKYGHEDDEIPPPEERPSLQ